MTAMMTRPDTAVREMTAQQRREQARRTYRESVAAELPMTAQALGEAFGRSTRWGHERIAEVRAEDTHERAEPPLHAPTDPRMQPDMSLHAETGTPAETQQTPTDEAHIPQPDTGSIPPDTDPTGPAQDDIPQPAAAAGSTPPTSPVSAPPARPVRAWPVLLLALPAFVAIWGGWVGLGEMTGFGEINLLPGIVPAGGWATINSAITLPIGVETYAAFALRAWLSPAAVSPRARRFAKWSAIGSLTLGFCGQVAYHQMAAAGITVAPWWITTLVSGLPVAVLGMGAALAHLLHHGRDGEQ